MLKKEHAPRQLTASAAAGACGFGQLARRLGALRPQLAADPAAHAPEPPPGTLRPRLAELRTLLSWRAQLEADPAAPAPEPPPDMLLFWLLAGCVLAGRAARRFLPTLGVPLCCVRPSTAGCLTRGALAGFAPGQALTLFLCLKVRVARLSWPFGRLPLTRAFIAGGGAPAIKAKNAGQGSLNHPRPRHLSSSQAAKTGSGFANHLRSSKAVNFGRQLPRAAFSTPP